MRQIVKFVKSGLLPKHIYQILSLTSFKYYLLKLELIKVSGLFLNIYRPPASNIQRFIDELSDILDKSFPRYDSIIVMGDINIDTTEAEQTKLANRFFTRIMHTL